MSGLFELIPCALWLGGLSLGLAAFSFNLVKPPPAPAGLAGHWAKAVSSRNTQPGWFLACLGLSLVTGWWPARLVWALLALYTMFQWWRTGRPPARQPEPDQVRSAPEISLERLTVSPDTNLKSKAKVFTFLEATRLCWVIALLPLFMFWQGHYLVFGLGLLAVLWLVTGLTTGHWGQRAPVNVCLVILLLLVPVTLLVTPSIELTVESLGYLLAELLLFYTVLSWVRTERRLITAATVLTAVGGLLALASPFVVIQSARFFPAIPQFNSLNSFLAETVHRNVLAGALVALLPVSFSLVIGGIATNRSKASLLFNGLIFILLAGGLILTQSRGAYLAGACSIVIVIGLNLRRRYQLGLLLGLLVIAALTLFFFADKWTELLTDYSALGGIDGRLELWSRAISAIQDFPFTGIGLGTFSVVIPVLYPYFLRGTEPVPHAHNLFLQVGVDLGLLGLIAFVAFIFVLGVAGWRAWYNWQAQGNRRLKLVAAGGLGTLGAVLVQGSVDAVSWGTKPACLTWAVLGLLMANFTLSNLKPVSPALKSSVLPEEIPV